MEHRQDNFGALMLSLAVHGVFVLCLALATLSCERYNALVERLQLPGFLSVQCMQTLSVQGPIIEASLVSYTPPPPRTQRQPVRPQKPQPPPPPPPQERIEAPQLPPVPPRADDRVNQQQVSREGQLPADEQREQEEKRRREQEVLEEQERLALMEQERQTQLEDVRRQREEAERDRKREEQRLAQLEDRQRAQAADRLRDDEREHQEQLMQQAGTEGTDDSLLGHYIAALQARVTDNWQRPDSALPGLKCTVRIVQIPGGEVLSATVVPPCNGDDLTRTSIEQAVMRAQPLPYEGYEKVFQRTVNFNFRYDG